MARWLRDADTGELFQEDELDPSSYESVSDWQPLGGQEEDPAQYAYPEWLTSGATSIPAKTLASLASGGASVERGLGDLFSNIPGLEDNWLQRDAAVNRKAIDDLLSQTRQDNEQEPGSFRDVATSAIGAGLGGLTTLGAGLYANAGRKALAAFPAIMPSADKYSALRDEGVSGGDAAQAAAESFVLNSLLNRVDVGAAFSPVATGRRIAQAGAVGAGTNMAGAYGDALIDKSVGATQTPEEFLTNLLSSGATGGVMGSGFAAMASPRVSADVDVPEGQAATDMLARMEQSMASEPVDGTFEVLPSEPASVQDASSPLPPDMGPQQPDFFTTNPDQLPVPYEPAGVPAEFPSNIPGPRSNWQPPPPDGWTRGSDYLYKDPAQPPMVVPDPGNQLPAVVSDPLIDGSQYQGPPQGYALNETPTDVRDLTTPPIIPEQGYDARSQYMERKRAQDAKQISNELDLTRRRIQAQERVSRSRGDLTGSLKTPNESDTFPTPLPLRKTEEASSVEPLQSSKSLGQPSEQSAIITEEGYNARTPEQIAQAQEFRRQVERIGLTPKEQISLFTENDVANIKPESTDPEALPKALKKRAVKRLGKYERSAERGDTLLFTDLQNVVRWAGGKVKGFSAPKATGDALPDYQDWSKTNKRYDDGTWGRVVEWMDTTARKEPASAKFIEGQWKIPQDTSAIVWDADATLTPYMQGELTPAEKTGVNTYLQAARVLGSRDAGYAVNAETATKAGLSPKQAQAALSVKNWSNFFADMFEHEALAQADHNAKIAQLQAPGDLAAQQKIAEKLAASQQKIGETFSEWRKSNYVPFDRYGEHFVNVFGADGKLIARQQFESPKDPAFAKAKRHYEELAKQPGEFFGATVKYGRQRPEALVQFEGVSQDILDMLGKDAKGDPIDGFSRHLKNAKLIKGQNIDLERAISQYTVGAARLLAYRRANRIAEIELATTLRGDDKINLRNKLKEWKDSLNAPTSGLFKGINEAFNFAYIGGNARTPTADIIGALQMQPLVLSKYLKGAEPEAVGVKTIANLAKWYVGKGIDPRLAAGIKEAQKKNIIPDDTLKQYIRKSRGSNKTMETLSQAKDAYFILKSMSERFVDAGAFMSGWEAYNKLPVQTRKGISQQQFAENIVREMRAVPSQGELPGTAMFRSETGRLALKYRLFQAKILKTMMESPLPGKVRYLVGVGMTTGLMGLPFIGRELFAMGRAAGYEPEDKLREMGVGSATMYGPLSKATGVDFSNTAGFGDFINTQANNPLQKFALGMIGAPFESLQRAGQYYARGQTDRAIGSLPISNLLSNYITQADWGDRGVVTMGGKAVIPRDEVTTTDRIKKLLGYQPLAVKEAMVLENRKKQAAAKAVNNQHINQRIGEAEGLGDYEAADALRAMAAEKGIKTNKASIKRYREMIQGKDKKYPKGARELIGQLEEIYSQGD